MPGMHLRAVVQVLPALALSFCALAGCVPARDNPNDPSRRPQAALQVVDWSPAGGRCPDEPLAPGVGAVSVAPIGHCLVLDARGSTDPQESPDLVFAFSGDGITAATSTSGTLVIPAEERLALPLGSVLTFHVTVTDPTGASASAEADVLLTNQRPTIAALRDFRLPAGGYPWRPGQDYVVGFEAGGADPDGDVIEHCWELTTGESGCVGRFDAFLTTIGIGEQRVVATVRAFDGISYSLPDTQSVTIAIPNPWTRGPSGSGPSLASVDGARRAIPVAPLGIRAGADFLDRAAGDAIAVVTSPGPLLTLVQWPSLAAGPSAAVDHDPQSSLAALHPRADGPRNRVWAAGIELTLGQRVRYAAQSWTVDAGATALAAELPYTTHPLDAGLDLPDNQLGTFPMAILSSAGEPWIARTFGAEVVSFAPNGTPFVDSLGEHTASGLAARPETGEVWVAATAGAGSAKLVRYDAERIRADFTLPSAAVQGLAFADRDRVWLVTPVHGLVLLDLEAFIGGASFESCLELSHPDVLLGFGDGPSVRTDPRTGGVYLTGDGVAWHAETSGFLESYDGNPMAFVDPAGALYFDQGGTLHRGSSTTVDGVAARSPQAKEAVAAYDWRGGGVWSVVAISPDDSAFLLVDPSGAANRTWGGVVTDAAPTVVESIATITNVLSASVDGSTLWALGGVSALTGEPIRLDAFRFGFGPVPVRVPFAVPQSSVDEVWFLEPLAPLEGGPARKAWAGVSEVVSILDATDASITPVYTFPEGAGSFSSGGSRSLRSNDLCFAVSDANTDPTAVSLRRLTTAGGTPQELASASLHPFAYVAAASDTEHDACWFATRSGATWTFRAWAKNGTLLHTTTSTSAPTSLHAESAHRLLVNRDGTVVRLTFSPSVGGALLAEETIATGVNAVFANR